MWKLGGILTPSSMMARLTVAPAPSSTPCQRMASSTLAPRPTLTPGESTAWFTVPSMVQPEAMRESPTARQAPGEM